MRVIAGTARGRRLVAPPGLTTRPTPGRVREALFSMLAPELADSRVLDLFGGTGAFAIEAVSRGAAHATVVEHNRRALEALRRNLDLVDRTRVRLLAMDARKALHVLAEAGETFDVAFLDPPFASDALETAVLALAERALISPSGLILCEHSRRRVAPGTPSGFDLLETRNYGEVALTWYRRQKGRFP